MCFKIYDNIGKIHACKLLEHLIFTLKLKVFNINYIQRITLVECIVIALVYRRRCMRFNKYLLSLISKYLFPTLIEKHRTIPREATNAKRQGEI